MSVYSLIIQAYLLPIMRFDVMFRIFWPVLPLIAIGTVLYIMANFAQLMWPLASGHDANMTDQHMVIVFISVIPFLLAAEKFCSGLVRWTRYLVNDEPDLRQRSWLPLRKEDHVTLIASVASITLTFILGAFAFIIFVGAVLGDKSLTHINPIVVFVYTLFLFACCGCFFTLNCLSVVGVIAGDGGYKWYATKKKLCFRDRLAFSAAFVVTLAPIGLLYFGILSAPQDWQQSTTLGAVGGSIYMLTAIVVTTMLSLFYRYRMAPDQATSAP